MGHKNGSARRTFLKQATALGVAPLAGQEAERHSETSAGPRKDPTYPRTFEGAHLSRIAFPLGGVAAGSLSLGGRGQLRDWEIFNRPNKGFSPPYAFPAIWVQSGSAKPVTRVLESRVLP